VPGLFAALCPEIDAHRRPGRFLLLGSASGSMPGQSAESLAGRIGYLELTPLLAAELRLDPPQRQAPWLRGGFALSYLAPNETASVTWRQDFPRTFLQRELPQPGGACARRDLAALLAHVGAPAGPVVQRFATGPVVGAWRTPRWRAIWTCASTRSRLPQAGPRVLAGQAGSGPGSCFCGCAGAAALSIGRGCGGVARAVASECDARQLIRLSGQSEDEIAVELSGLRPGEKLYEELLAHTDTTMATPIPRLRIALLERLSALVAGRRRHDRPAT
jgi:hypothetical protein